MENVYIKEVLKEAKKAYNIGEVPVGAIIIKDGIIISKAYNTKEKTNNPINHAEIIAIKKACKKLNNWRLDDCTMLVTLQPCPMCASAIKQSRIKEVIYFIEIDNENMKEITENIFNSRDNNKKVIYKKNDNDQYENMLNTFFKDIRK